MGSYFSSTSAFTRSSVSRKMKRERSIVPNRFETAGNRHPFTRSNRSAGPPARRRACGWPAISRCGIDLLPHADEVPVPLQVIHARPQARIPHQLFALFIAASALYTMLLAPPLLSLLEIDPASAAALRASAAGTGVGADLPPFRDWIVALVPANPVEAAATGAMLPLIVFAALFGLAITRTADAARQSLLTFFRAVADAMFVLIGWVLELAPIGVVGLVLPLAATMGAAAAGAMGYFVGLSVLLVIGGLLALYPVTALLAGIPIREFARGVAAAQMVGFSTRSSLASLPAMLEGAEKRLGLPAHVTSLSLPAAVSIFKYASPMVRLTGTLFIAQLYGIELTTFQFIALSVAVSFLSFYSPGIPSGGLLVMTPLYIEFGLPVEGIGILIALDLIPDMFITAANVTADVSVAAILTRRGASAHAREGVVTGAAGPAHHHAAVAAGHVPPAADPEPHDRASSTR
jgi:proton glutamate symport protein